VGIVLQRVFVVARESWSLSEVLVEPYRLRPVSHSYQQEDVRFVHSIVVQFENCVESSSA